MRLLPGDAREKEPWGKFLKEEEEWKHRSKVKQTLASCPSFRHSPQSQAGIQALLLNQSVRGFTSDLVLMEVFLKKAYIDQLLIDP